MSQELAIKLEGLYTLDLLAQDLGVKPKTAINIATKLRKEGYLRTTGGGDGPRWYHISPLKQRDKDFSSPGGSF